VAANSFLLLAQAGAGDKPSRGVAVLLLVVALVILIGIWKVFVKAGQPGWGCLIPIYNAYLFCHIAGKPGWWVLLLLIPGVNVIIGIVLTIDLARNFGKGVFFAFGLLFLGFIFYPILGYGSAEYRPIAPRS
jgi:ABC-type sulfate transport system permease subunit